MDSAVALVSGGICSTTAACLRRDTFDILPLYLAYGRASELREKAAASSLAKHLGLQLQVLDLPHVLQISRSPDQRLGESNDRPGSPTHVPGLMASMLTTGAEYAAAVGAHTMIIGLSSFARGAEQNELSQERRVDPWSFRHAYGAFSETSLPKVRAVRLDAPLMDLDAGHIVKLGMRAATPFEITWSCHQPDVPCGTCPGCAFRASAFAAAGQPDPASPLIAH